jgi:hypothetical protein
MLPPYPQTSTNRNKEMIDVTLKKNKTVRDIHRTNPYSEENDDAVKEQMSVDNVNSLEKTDYN